MPLRLPDPKVPARAERSALTANPELACAVCGRPRSPRGRETCSDGCRTALSRIRREEALQKRDEDVRVALDEIVRLVHAVRTRLGSTVSRQGTRARRRSRR